MTMRCLRLIAGPVERLPDAWAPHLEDLPRLKERRGEKIAAFAPDSMTLLGTLTVSPDRDEGGRFCHLVGLEVLPGHRQEGVDVALMEEARVWLAERRVTRLKFGTSPLLTSTAHFYMTRYGTRYHWREGTHTPDGHAWPYVSCECDFDDPLARPLDLRDEELAEHSVLRWVGGRPRVPPNVVYSGPLTVLLPELTSDSITATAHADPSFLGTLFDVFHGLHVHGYGFAWFDLLPGAPASADDATYVYIMNRTAAI
jgi:GNAT superfamily N-acetyltransferase